jgi:ABC-type antimicrobial peptide transport system permease subunit
MRKFLAIASCVGLASLVGAAQHDENNNQFKKKGGGNAPAQQQPAAAPQTGKKFYKTGQGQGQGNAQFKSQNFQQPGTATYKGNKAYKKQWQGQAGGPNQTNLNSNAANTKFNKTKFGSGNAKFGSGNPANAGNLKFQKKQFNLQTNNKQYVINKYKTVNYNANYKFPGAYKWKGNPKYQVFVNYHPQWHDTWWWNWHHPHVTFIYGGWYYWDNSYWYPAWGYAPDSVYYYDGPIYSSSPAEDPAQTVANVQSALQQQGFYQGDIDGVLGPQTRAALAEYQTAQGLEPTGTVDEPTLETLGMV